MKTMKCCLKQGTLSDGKQTPERFTENFLGEEPQETEETIE